MSSIHRQIIAAGLLAASVAAAAAQLGGQPGWIGAQGYGGVPAAPAYDPIADAVSRWNRLRQTDSYGFSDYAGFLLSYPGWPGESAMRKTAERRLADTAVAPADVVRFFDRFPPVSNGGRAHYADALANMGRADAALAMARQAWAGGALADADEVRLRARFGGSFTQDDQDRRMDRLLWDRATAAAARQIASVSPTRQPLFDARLAIQTNRADAAEKASTFISVGAHDAGFIADRARYLRDTGRSVSSRGYLAQPHTLDAPPLDAEKWLEILLLNARGASNDNQSTTVWQIALQADSAFPAGTVIRERSLSERDDYTSLVWLGGITALKKLGRPADAVLLFDRYARAARSPQTQTKGLYWAGRASLAAGNIAAADAYFASAAAPDQFYGQLANERLGRLVSAPVLPPISVTPAERQAFASSAIVRAAIYLGRTGQRQDQSIFLRTIAENGRTPADHMLADELASMIGRPDLGVMVARNARNVGVSDFVPAGFPQVSVPPTQLSNWVMIHAISRQESQFDREAVSHAGARGLMQLMPGTARETAGKLGLPYDFTRLTQDPSYNILLGSTFFQRILEYYGGNHVLAVAAYNAGPGNVNRWLRDNGDPRMGGVDVIDWIEAIPISETRGYVQRVLENAVVYDALNPQHARMPAQNRLSAYLGKRLPG